MMMLIAYTKKSHNCPDPDAICSFPSRIVCACAHSAMVVSIREAVVLESVEQFTVSILITCTRL
jgi:hypothetical protein